MRRRAALLVESVRKDWMKEMSLALVRVVRSCL